MSILTDYYAELEYAKKLKSDGVTVVAAVVAGSASDISIDEYIQSWVDGIVAMENGEPEENYNY